MINIKVKISLDFILFIQKINLYYLQDSCFAYIIAIIKSQTQGLLIKNFQVEEFQS